MMIALKGVEIAKLHRLNLGLERIEFLRLL